METRGEVPPGFLQDEAYYEFHRELGVGFYLQGYEPFRPIYDDNITVEEHVEGDQRIRTVHTPLGSLSETQIYLPRSFTHARTEHLVKAPQDLAILRYWFEHTRYEPDYTEAARRHALVQSLGVVLCYLPKTPFMQLVVLLAGIGTVVNLWMEVRAELENTLEVMEEKADEAAAIALASPAECLMIPENLSSEVVGRRFFGLYVHGYEEKWNQRIREAGKYSFIHMDGTVRGLVREVASTGFRVIEAVTPAPVGDLAMGEMAAWAGPGPILWGGLPGIYFTPLVDDAEFERMVREMLSVMASEPRYVLGVADQVPPDGLRRRVAQVRELVERYGAYS